MTSEWSVMARDIVKTLHPDEPEWTPFFKRHLQVSIASIQYAQEWAATVAERDGFSGDRLRRARQVAEDIAAAIRAGGPA